MANTTVNRDRAKNPPSKTEPFEVSGSTDGSARRSFFKCAAGGIVGIFASLFVKPRKATAKNVGNPEICHVDSYGSKYTMVELTRVTSAGERVSVFKKMYPIGTWQYTEMVKSITAIEAFLGLLDEAHEAGRIDMPYSPISFDLHIGGERTFPFAP